MEDAILAIFGVVLVTYTHMMIKEIDDEILSLKIKVKYMDQQLKRLCKICGEHLYIDDGEDDD